MQPLKRLADSGMVRIIDLVVLHKDSDGVVTALELEGLEPDEAALFDDLDGDVLGLLNDDDITFAGEALAPGQQRCRPGLEDTWATAFGQAVKQAGGWVVANDRFPVRLSMRRLRPRLRRAGRHEKTRRAGSQGSGPARHDGADGGRRRHGVGGSWRCGVGPRPQGVPAAGADRPAGDGCAG